MREQNDTTSALFKNLVISQIHNYYMLFTHALNGNIIFAIWTTQRYVCTLCFRDVMRRALASAAVASSTILVSAGSVSFKNFIGRPFPSQ